MPFALVVRSEEIRPRDLIWFPPSEKHWHDASPTTAMTHIAIQEQLDGKAVDWMEKVCFYRRLQAESLSETWLLVLFEFRARMVDDTEVTHFAPANFRVARYRKQFRIQNHLWIDISFQLNG